MRMTARKKVIKKQKRCCGTLRMWYLAYMQDNTTATAETTVETFLALVKKDAEMYSFPDEYFKQYLVNTLKAMCRNEQGAIAYIQNSTRWMEQDQARQAR
jgi:hypothetical protein